MLQRTVYRSWCRSKGYLPPLNTTVRQWRATLTLAQHSIVLQIQIATSFTFDHLKAEAQLLQTTELRQVNYLNNRVEQAHRFIKRLTKPGMGFGYNYCPT